METPARAVTVPEANRSATGTDANAPGNRDRATVPPAIIEAMARADAAARAKRLGEAAGICTDVLAAIPNHPPALALLGTLLAHRGETARGIALLERAITGNAKVPLWHSNLAVLYRFAYRFEAAIEAAQRAVTLAPASAAFRVNLGVAHADRGEGEDAITCFLAALGHDQEHPAAHLALAQALLARGDFAPGWREYEWRNKIDQAKGMLPKMHAAPWNGMRLPNGRLLLVADQGFGDSIQFCRYIPRAAERAGEVVLGCSAELAPLLARIPGIAAIHHRWSDIPPHAAYCLLSSLPLLFGTEAGSIPADVPYLQTDPARRTAWREKLAAALPGGRLRVGLAWSGRPTHPNDRRRSLGLAQLAPITRLSNITLVPLQPRVQPAEAKLLAGLPNVAAFADDLKDFSETAALIVNLDLVISIDTSVAHLAGALSREVWTMLPLPADWRWLTEREDSPWYPTMRLFRQPRPGAWEPVISEVAAALCVQATRHAAAA